MLLVNIAQARLNERGNYGEMYYVRQVVQHHHECVVTAGTMPPSGVVHSRFLVSTRPEYVF